MAGKPLQTDERSPAKRKSCEDKTEEDVGEHSKSIAVRSTLSDRKLEKPPPLLHMSSHPLGRTCTFPHLTPDTTLKRSHETEEYDRFYAKRQLLFPQASSEKKYQDYRPTLPGTPCQFRSSTLDNIEEETNLMLNSSPFNPNQTLKSPESGLTFTPPPNAQSSPSVSCLHGLSTSSGIGSAPGIEMECMEYDIVNFVTPWNIGQESLNDAESEKTKRNSYKIQRMQKFLQRRFVYLKNEMMPREVASRLYNDNVIQRKDLEAVTDAEGRRHKCDVLIKAISHSLESGNGNIVQRIKDAFAKEKYDYVFNDFEVHSSPAESIDPENMDSMQWKKKLLIFAAKMEDELDPRHFIDDLVSEEVLELDEHQNIMTVPFKPEKVTCLIKYLQKKSKKAFDSFCKVIKKSYHSNALVDALCNTQPFDGLKMEELKEPKVPPSVNIVRKEEHICQLTPTATAHIKFKFDGDAEDIERMIVEENSPNPNDTLQEEAMDIGAFEILETTFSSIRIVLSALSQRSEMQILKKCKQSPVFLMKFLQSLIKTEHLQKLKDRNIRRIFFEIKVQWPESKVILKEDITRNLGFLGTRITKEEIVRVLENVERSEAILDDIKNMESSKQCFYKFAEFLLSEESETVVDAFVEELKKNERDEIIAKLKNSKRSCSCQLVKESIVDHYTLIEKEMDNVEDIIKAFSEFPGFSVDVQDEFKELLGNSPKETRLDSFLRKMLKLPDDGLQLCLLEERLHATGQIQLLEKVTKSASNKEDIQITEEDIRKNRIFLCDEMEPKQYFDIFNDTEDVCEQLLSAPSREVRCEILLDFLLKKCIRGDKNIILSKFSRELLKRNPEVLQYIKDSRRSRQIGELQPLKENIISSYKHIVEEVEPLVFLKFFEERQELSKEEIERIRNPLSRRSRAIALMNCVLKGSETKAMCLMDALCFAGYVSLLKKLQENLKNYKDCPRIYHALQDSNKCFMFKGELEIDFNAENPAELQQSSRMPVFNKWSLVTNWVLENYFAIKREEITVIQEEENKENNIETKKRTSEQPVADLTEGEYRSNPLRKSCKDKVDVCSFTEKANIAKQQTTTTTCQDTSSPMLSDSDLTGQLSGCQCSNHSRCLLDPLCGGITKSPCSNYGFNPIRNDEIFDNNSASCSPSSTIPSRVSRNGSSEDENGKIIQEIPQGDEALKMFDEGSIC